MATSQHIFICYSPDDAAIMRRIRDNLQRVGLKIWASEGIDPGSEQWRKQVPSAVRNAAVVVVLMSPAANDSEWVEREIDLAKSIGAPILPLMVSGEVHRALLPALAEMEYIDLRDDYEGNIIQVIRLCYEYRQQDDARTTTELRQAMADDEDVAAPAPSKPTKPDKSGRPAQPTKPSKPTHEDVKVFVRQIASVEDIVQPETDEDLRRKVTERRLFLVIATVVVIIGVLAGLFAIFLVSGLNPFELGREIEETIVASGDVTEEVTLTVEVSPTVAATATIEATATDVLPTATPTASATRVPPTATTAPTATRVPPTATPIPPTPMPTATVIPPTATPIPPTQPPTNTPEPTLVTVTEGNIELKYNGNTLVVHNISTGDVNLSGVQFILVGDSAEDSVMFLADEWGMPNNLLQNNRCAQVWDVEFAEIPPSEPPANECGARSAFRATPRNFWIIEGDKTIFEMRRNGNILAQCEAAPEGNETIMRCMVQI